MNCVTIWGSLQPVGHDQGSECVANAVWNLLIFCIRPRFSVRRRCITSPRQAFPKARVLEGALKLGIFIESTERESWKGWVDFREQERLAENLEPIADVNL